MDAYLKFSVCQGEVERVCQDRVCQDEVDGISQFLNGIMNISCRLPLVFRQDLSAPFTEVCHRLLAM
jgi:hypothetical protein